MAKYSPLEDALTIADKTFTSRLLIGSARYPNNQVMVDAIAARRRRIDEDGTVVVLDAALTSILHDIREDLAEFGTVIPDDVEVRVHDSTADLRYMIIPRRPAGSERRKSPSSSSTPV